MLGLQVLGTATNPRKQPRAQDGLLDTLGPLNKMTQRRSSIMPKIQFQQHGIKTRDGKLQRDDEKSLLFR